MKDPVPYIRARLPLVQDHIMFKFTNFVTPGTIYHGTVSKGGGDGGTADVSLKVYRETKVPGITSTDFETKQVRRLPVAVDSLL